MIAVNYQKELEKLIDLIKQEGAGKEPPTLLLHSCCAPCSSYVLKYLREYFSITVFYYNPNIGEQSEYRKRVEEQKRLIQIYNTLPGNEIQVIEGDYEPEVFFDMARDFKNCREGGERCFNCYELRLKKTAQQAKLGNFTYFGTTLTISPLKNAKKLNEIGYELEARYGVNWLPSDFKKKEGYKQSIILSEQYDLYRQDYCGCIYSKIEREMKQNKIGNEK